MKIKVLISIFALTLLVGCGGSGGTDSGGTNTNTGGTGGDDGFGGGSDPAPNVQTGHGVYSATATTAINGINYKCGSKTGVTGDNDIDGNFTYEVDKDCDFTINGSLLTRVAGANLIDGNRVYPNHQSARYLQSLDDNANPNDGIEILPAVVNALKDIPGIQRADDDVQAMVNALINNNVSDYNGAYVTMSDAGFHLSGFRMNITAEATGDNITLDAGTGVAGLSYLWKEGETTLGSGSPLVIPALSMGTHTIDLTVMKEDRSPLIGSLKIIVNN